MQGHLAELGVLLKSFLVSDSLVWMKSLVAASPVATHKCWALMLPWQVTMLLLLLLHGENIVFIPPCGHTEGVKRCGPIRNHSTKRRN